GRLVPRGRGKHQRNVRARRAPRARTRAPARRGRPLAVRTSSCRLHEPLHTRRAHFELVFSRARADSHAGARATGRATLRELRQPPRSRRTLLHELRFRRGGRCVVIDSKQLLGEQAEREVMACIGCNDCLLACPLPEKKFVTIAELNAAVHLPMVTGKGIVDFLAACTQCRQCVPACPADLSRADMVLFNKMKVEDTVPNHMLPLQFGGTVTQSAWMLDGLAAQLTHLPIFAGAAVTDLRRLLLTVTLRQLVPGEELCREGEFHERLYV